MDMYEAAFPSSSSSSSSCIPAVPALGGKAHRGSRSSEFHRWILIWWVCWYFLTLRGCWVWYWQRIDRNSLWDCLGSFGTGGYKEAALWVWYLKSCESFLDLGILEFVLLSLFHSAQRWQMFLTCLPQNPPAVVKLYFCKKREAEKYKSNKRKKCKDRGRVTCQWWKGKRRTCLEVNDLFLWFWRIIVNPLRVRTRGSSVWQVRECPSPLALDTRELWHTPALSTVMLIPAWKQFLLSVSAFQMHIWCQSSSAAFRTPKPQVFLPAFLIQGGSAAASTIGRNKWRWQRPELGEFFLVAE